MGRVLYGWEWPAFYTVALDVWYIRTRDDSLLHNHFITIVNNAGVWTRLVELLSLLEMSRVQIAMIKFVVVELDDHLIVDDWMWKFFSICILIAMLSTFNSLDLSAFHGMHYIYLADLHV